MKWTLSAAVVGILTAAAAGQDTRPSIERFLKIRTPGQADIAPDGTMYVRDWPDGVYQLYRVEGDAAGPGKPATRLTDFPDGLAGYSISPDGSLILLAHAVGGNENTQYSVLDPRAGEGKGRIAPVLVGPRVQFAVNLWLRDANGFVYTANDASPNDFNIYRFDFAKDPFAGAAGKSTLLLNKPGSWEAADISADGSRLLVANFRSASDSSMYELNTKTGELTDLTPKPEGGGTAAVSPVGYLPGETAVLYTCDIDGGMMKLFARDLKTGAVSRPIPDLEGFELDGASMSREKTLLAVAANEDGYGVPHLYRLPTLEAISFPASERGVVSLSSLRGNRLIYTMSNARTPGLAFAWDVPGAKSPTRPGPARQITFADDQGIDLSKFPLPTLVKYKSFDGTEIPAFLFVPPGYKDGTPIPFIAYYHGGPEGQHRPAFSAQLQYLLNEGFGIIQPNVRGSTGYGRSFHMMDDYTKRWDSVKDGVEAAAWLVKNGYAKPGKIATFGGSYGGFMSVACLVEDEMRVEAGTQKERLFGAGVDVVGIVNMRTFLEKTSGYRRKLREAEYGPLTDPEFLASVSSMTRIDQLKVPMFIAHGFNDPRVPVEEAMQLAVALKDRHVPVQLFIAPDEGHGFQKLDNRLYFGERMSAFLKDAIGKQSR